MTHFIERKFFEIEVRKIIRRKKLDKQRWIFTVFLKSINNQVCFSIFNHLSCILPTNQIITLPFDCSARAHTVVAGNS